MDTRTECLRFPFFSAFTGVLPAMPVMRDHGRAPHRKGGYWSRDARQKAIVADDAYHAKRGTGIATVSG